MGRVTCNECELGEMVGTRIVGREGPPTLVTWCNTCGAPGTGHETGLFEKMPPLPGATVYLNDNPALPAAPTAPDEPDDLYPPRADPAAVSVHVALARVLADMPDIAKDQEFKGGKSGNYKFRGIDRIASVARPLFGRHGVIVVPDVDVTSVEPSTNGYQGWYDTRVTVRWTIKGPDGSTLNAKTHGVGRDNSDKGINKAVSQAFKYLLVPLLMIGDSADDGDHHAPPVAEGRRTDTEIRQDVDQAAAELAEFVDEARQRIKALPANLRAELSAEWVAEDPHTGEPWLPSVDGKPWTGGLTGVMAPAVRGLLAKYEAKAEAALKVAPGVAGGPSGDGGGDPAVETIHKAVQDEELAAATTYREVVDRVHKLSNEQCHAEMVTRSVMPDPAWDNGRLRAETAGVVLADKGIKVPGDDAPADGDAEGKREHLERPFTDE